MIAAFFTLLVLCVKIVNTFGKPEWRLLDSPGIAYYICELLHSSSPEPNNLFKPVFSTNMQDLFGFDITTRKREVNYIVELNGIKHIYLPVYLTVILGPSIK